MTPYELASILRCPRSGNALRFVPAPELPFGEVTFGTLQGGVRIYPVVDGVPILMDGHVDVLGHVSSEVEAHGPGVDRLVALITSGRSRDALVQLLAMPPRLLVAGRELPGAGRVASVPLVRSAAMRGRYRTLHRALAGGVRGGELGWWLTLFHQRSLGMDREIGHYFSMRTTQPRYLALQAVIPFVLSGDRASIVNVLDLACGLGHVCRELNQADPSAQCVGLDRTFHQLWLAKHWVAPASSFVCCDAAGRLPLAPGSVGSVVCSDAFHYLPDAHHVAGELERVCPSGPVSLARVANSQFEPHEGHERDPSGWLELFPDRGHSLLSEDELIDSYLARTPPEAPRDLSGAGATAKWLSMLTWRGERPSPTDPWGGSYPHGRGRLIINPAYRLTPSEDGIVGVLELPSGWFEFENGAMRRYCAAQFRMSTADLDDLRAGRRTTPIEQLVSSFVLISSASDVDPPP